MAARSHDSRNGAASANGGATRPAKHGAPRRARSRAAAPKNGDRDGGHGGGGAPRRLGVWLIGAKGDVATTVAVGLEAMRLGLADRTGLITETDAFAGCGVVPLESIILGGHDVRDGDPIEQARALHESSRLFGDALLDAVAPGLARFGARIRRGFVSNSGPVVTELLPAADRKKTTKPSRAFAQVKADIARFRETERCDAVVVINIASTEPTDAPPACYDDADALLRAIAADDPSLHASVIYAAAAIDAGVPHINFTPSFGSAIPALIALACRRGVPHMGRDGKTGETLVKSALAPLFVARALRVLSWTGQNILGNRDGRVLEDPTAKRSKTVGKDRVLRAVLGDRIGATKVGIDFVPGLGDWKTAWDHIHFEGFLGTRMTLQFTWTGADSALAAPLIIDLARIVERAARAGRTGLLPELGVFFKNPTGVEEHGLVHQLDVLLAMAEELRTPEALLARARAEHARSAETR